MADLHDAAPLLLYRHGAKQFFRRWYIEAFRTEESIAMARAPKTPGSRVAASNASIAVSARTARTIPGL
ncbi:hypothetical protein AB4Y43_35175 [Paraburkholderia sp. BR10872]|uniref:hypothetical protein n=1 Tax=Paraburkholderia sp. BR10872 TaxID=3236989 RepID=UPI0034D243D8